MANPNAVGSSSRRTAASASSRWPGELDAPMMGRRRFACAATCGILATPLVLRAQGTAKVRRIGWLGPSSPPSPAEIEEQLAPLRELGWIEGRNLLVERRFTKTANAELLRSSAEDLVRLKVELIVTDGTDATLAAKRATSLIPIVMRSAGDPVGAGLVTSLAKPGGNVTGFSILYPEIFAKGVALLLELLPGLQRIGVLLDSTSSRTRAQRGELERACRSMGTQLIVVEVGGASELKTAIGEVARQRAQALVLVPAPLVIDNDNNLEIARDALNHALPTLGNWKEEAEAGALLWLNFSLMELRRRGAAYIDKILRGARPADLPVEQPTQFETGINLRTARALGITVPQSLLLRADALIQ